MPEQSVTLSQMQNELLCKYFEVLQCRCSLDTKTSNKSLERYVRQNLQNENEIIGHHPMEDHPNVEFVGKA